MKKSKIYLSIGTILFCCVLAFLSYKNKQNKQAFVPEPAYEIVLEWNKMILQLERHTAGYRPPVSARMFAYVGLCAYEVATPSLQQSKSSSILPATYQSVSPDNYDLPLALNAAYSQLLKSFFASAPLAQLNELNELEAKLEKKYTKEENVKTQENGIEFGRNIAKSIWNYAKSDSVGHNAYLFNYDKNYMPPNCKGCWQPFSNHPMPALLPYWSKVRTFVAHDAELACRPPLTFDDSRNSPFHFAAMEVFLSSQNLSYEDIWIAEFWADDFPQLTVTPVGRWFSIANQCFEQKKYTFEQIIHTYYQLGIALNDAAVICWAAKYRYNVERPEPYIRRNIAANWTSLHESPSFPSYPSGHATFGAVAVEIFKNNLGEINGFTDQTHKERPEFRSRPRSYDTFDEMAKENAFSRLPMGVHYRMDCEEGFRIGKIIGKIVKKKVIR